VHLETILKDLRERFARCELVVSPPLVAFRESVAADADAPEAATRPAQVRSCSRSKPAIAAFRELLTHIRCNTACAANTVIPMYGGCG